MDGEHGVHAACSGLPAPAFDSLYTLVTFIGQGVLSGRNGAVGGRPLLPAGAGAPSKGGLAGTVS